MTITEIANVAGCHRDTVKGMIKTIYPNLKAKKRGLALILNEEQAKNIMDKLPKKNYVELPVENAPTDMVKNHQVDYELIGQMIAVAVSSAMKPLIEELKESREPQQTLLPAPKISNRDYLNRLVREYAEKKLDNNFQGAYRELYKEILYRLKINVKVRSKNEGISKMDYLDREGLIPVCVSIMTELIEG